MLRQRAFAVNRIACRAVFLFFFGGPIIGPLRAPFFEAKKLLYAASRSRKDCWSTTADTSPSQARSGVFFASVMTRFDSSAAAKRGRPLA
ncbi:hypothetical protein ACH4S9_33870 [Streptomyces sp. NPDC021225]|uniref:hypothetical protein n=1 Tax=Streptomyces sp. NPDC021225 TaxID=3365121 RepID=UPI003791F13C